MFKHRREAMQQVADKLFAAENAIDAALSSAAELNAALPAARLHANVSAVVGQEPLESVAEAVTALVRARHQLVRAHHQLNDTKAQMGLRTVAVGGGMPKPVETTGLRLVEDVA
jgi:hypothetical protein